MRALSIIVAVSANLAASSAYAQAAPSGSRSVPAVAGSPQDAQTTTNLAAINQKLSAEAKQARRAQGIEIDTKGTERGMRQQINQMRAFCSNQYVRC